MKQFIKTNESIFVEEVYVHQIGNYKDFYTTDTGIKRLIELYNINNRLGCVYLGLFLLGLLGCILTGAHLPVSSAWMTGFTVSTSFSLISLALTIVYGVQTYLASPTRPFENSQEFKIQYEQYVAEYKAKLVKINEEKRRKQAEQIVNICNILDSTQDIETKIKKIMESLK